ncbi:MAG: 30S ribosomal protein S20 [Candidatus Eremiobacterota bacterium]
MANTKTAKKMIKVHDRRRKRNQPVRTAIKSVFKKAEQALESKDADLTAVAKEAASVIDKAAAKGIVHKNKAARKKSRLDRKVAAASKG